MVNEKFAAIINHYFCAMRKQKLSKYVMLVAILLIAAFQAYWLRSLYKQEWTSLKTQANVLLKQTIQNLEDDRISNDTNILKLKNQGIVLPEKLCSPNIISAKANQKPKPQPTFTLKRSNPILMDSIDQNIQRRFRADSAIFIGPGVTLTKLFKDSLNAYISPNDIKSIHVIKDSGKNRVGGNGAIVISSKYNLTTAYLKDSLRKNAKEKSFRYDTSFATTNGFKVTASLKTVDTFMPKNFGTIVFRLFNDTLPVKKVDSLFKQTLKKDKVNVPFTLIAKKAVSDTLDSVPKNKLITNIATIHPLNNNGYQVEFKNPFWYIISKIKLPIAFSVLLLLIVSAAFVFLYKNMVAQQRLALMKNDFISNITHELKTPIATVNVAIEALRNFNALNNAQKTKEYLEISANEINRLSGLVDKVLKLSMFENDKIDLVKEDVNAVMLLKECLSSMRLQFENKEAIAQFNCEYDSIIIQADSLHLSSVFLNLMDNALKYTTQPLLLTINIHQQENQLIVEFKDNGIGISKADQQKIFQKFYRISQGVDKHNVKGYGLGLSYVHYIIKKHGGTISVNSELQKGSCFTISLPIN